MSEFSCFILLRLISSSDPSTIMCSVSLGNTPHVSETVSYLVTVSHFENVNLYSSFFSLAPALIRWCIFSFPTSLPVTAESRKEKEPSYLCFNSLDPLGARKGSDQRGNVLEKTKCVKRSPFLSPSLPRRRREETWRGRRPSVDTERSPEELG